MIPLYWISILYAGAAGLAFAMPPGTRFWCLVMLTASYLFLVVRGSVSLSRPILGHCIIRGRPENAFALTFDDGPDPRSTHAILNLLGEHDVVATFFCVGKHVEEHPDIVQRIHNEGHLIGNHSYSHSVSLTFANPTRLSDDISRCQDAIEACTDYRPRFYRPPYGIRNHSTQSAATYNKVLVTGWCAGGLDTTNRSVKSIVDRCLGSLGPGAIVLLHDRGPDTNRTLEIVSKILDAAQRRGLHPVRLDDLI